MRAGSRRSWIIIAIVLTWLGLAILLVLGLRESLRLILAEPLVYFSDVFRVLGNMIPQPLCWGVLILIGLGWFLRGMTRRATPSQVPEDEALRYPKRERVDFWLLQIRHAQDINSRGRFADFISKLIGEVVAYQTRQSPQFSERMHSGVQLNLPEDIQKILNNWRAQSFRGRKGMISNIWKGALIQGKGSGDEASPSFERELDAVVSYLEEQLEIKT